MNLRNINWAKSAAVLVTLVGLGVTFALLAAFGFADVLAVLRRVGVLGFALYTAYTMVILSLLGVCWYWLLPPQPVGATPGWLRTLVWGRLTREAATDVLPFAQLGGIVVGARSVMAGGVPAPLVYASLVADQTIELAAQLVYTLYAVAALVLLLSAAGNGAGAASLGAAGSPDVVNLAIGGLGLSVLIMAAFAFAQRPLLVFAARVAAFVLPGSAAALDGVKEALDAMYRRRRAVLASFVLHVACWVGGGAGAWVGLHFMGIDLPLQSILVIEGLIFTLRSAAFLLPGAIGLQEGAYVLLGPLFGLPPEAGLALSLLKRARDLAVGVPIMLAWQWGEGRGLLKSDSKA